MEWFSRNSLSTNFRIYLAVTWSAHEAPANPLEHTKSRTRGSGADGGVRPTCLQKTRPTRAMSVRGCRKYVPLNVDRKLYRATLLVMLAMSKDAVNFSCFSVWNRLSVPIPRLKTLRGFTRSAGSIARVPVFHSRASRSVLQLARLSPGARRSSQFHAP